MNLVVCILGAEVLRVSTEPAEASGGAGEASSFPVGFTASQGDQRWEKGVETL